MMSIRRIASPRHSASQIQQRCAECLRAFRWLRGFKMTDWFSICERCSPGSNRSSLDR
jgi:hypothetical protein